MTNYNKLLNNLEYLDLLAIKDSIPAYLNMITNDQKTIVDALYELSEKELDLRHKRAISACVKTAGFPFYKTIDDFDFNFQPSVDRAKISDLLSLRFIENKENVLFLGSSGVGKTHLATAIGIEAAKNRCSTHFYTFQDLIEQLKRAESEGRLERRLKMINRYKLLIIDEIGYVNFDRSSANLFFQLISRRYEDRSTIITTNQSLSKWSSIFQDPVIANAILDRLLHHSHIINIVGQSYRMKDVIDMIDE